MAAPALAGVLDDVLDEGGDEGRDGEMGAGAG